MSKAWAILKKENGEIANKKIVRALFDSLKDGRHLIEISGADKRSNPQNRYYWGLVIPIIQKGIKDMGTELTKEETHEWLKSKFNLSDLINPTTGECISIPLSTTRLNKEGFSEYISKIQQFASEFLNIYVPDPNEQMKFSYDD